MAAESLRLVSPEGRDVTGEDWTLGGAVPDIEGATLGFLDNTKHNARLLLRTLADLLGERGASAVHGRKPNSVIDGGPITGELAAKSRGIITGTGD
ncbi:MAG: hypothetical protein KY469_14350 [Actinobacteria bacterium]|nr:hypothetical protein [Actinomycetota bacterium]